MDENTALEYGFLGTGWSYILGRGISINGEGGIALMHGEYDVAKSIYIILSTAPGERVMRTEFGCSVHDLVFATPGPQSYGLVSYYVERALARWEPRIEVENVDVGADPRQPECMLIDVSYKIRANNSNRNLVYPFYVIPRNEDY